MKNIYRNLIQIGIILGFLGTVTVNALANILPINGKNTGELSDSIPNLFVPAGLTFSIWAVIYIALAALTIYSSLSLFQKNVDPPEYLEKFGIEFLLVSLANISWILLWHYQKVELSLIAMGVLLASLISMYIRLEIGKKDVTKTKKWFLYVPISLYLGWITIATVANVTAVLVVNDWNRFGASEEFWTIFMITVASIITLLILALRTDFAYSGVVIWAFIGIIIKRSTTSPVYPGIIIVTSIFIGVFSLVIGIRSFQIIKNN